MKRKFGICVLLALTACSSTPENQDPHKTFNKNALQFNMDFDDYILRPAASGYKTVVPEAMQISFANFFMNWKEPFYSINYILASDAEHAANALFRFVINSTIGFLGLFDVAENIGLEKAATSYEATLKKMDIPNGDFIMLPIFGASSTRDTIAKPISWLMDPVGYFIGLPYMVLKASCYAISDRASNMDFVDDMKRDPANLYPTMKSAYFQKYGSSSSKTSDLEDSPSPESDDE